MKFNIIISQNGQDEQLLNKLLLPLNDVELYNVLTVDEIKNYIEFNAVYLFIINTEIISLDLLNNIKDIIQDIPVLISNKLDLSLAQDIFLYDLIDLNNSMTSFNKINFCYKLYKKELEYEGNVQKLLYEDSLTSLPNRNKLIQDVRNDQIGITSLCVVDIKSFKDINDFFGHRVGDIVLKDISNFIEDQLLEFHGDILLYKFPSDIYCLANKALPHDMFEEVIISIVNSINKLVLHIDEHEIDVQVTAGITFSPKNNKLITADLALQAAKKEHKDYLVFYDKLDNFEEYQNNMKWMKKLKLALETDNIVVYFQPLVNNETMKVDKYECLVRMIDSEEDRVISPFFFLELSKKANLYSKITKIVIEKAFAQFEHLDFEFSVNVSYEDIEDADFMDFVKEMLNKYGVAKRVVWEILEDEGIKNYDVLFNFIAEVKKFGCKIAIDDFGSGYSNFEHLLKMNIDYLKIDASLVKNVAKDENSYQVVRTIIEFAESLNLKTIVEYVESKEIFNITKELGADYSQGYYFSAPIAQPSLTQF